jgi:eukaryotic translation initiation factor 2C
LIVISAVKRTHTRLFPFKKEDGDRKLGNVGVGSIVEAAPQSMFLVSHAALQGTVRPCRYTVLLNERSDSFSVDDFERLAMNATFSYGRATRSVSIHPAIYYADQVAERARMHLNTVDGETVLKDVHENLALTMYWQ